MPVTWERDSNLLYFEYYNVKVTCTIKITPFPSLTNSTELDHFQLKTNKKSLQKLTWYGVQKSAWCSLIRPAVSIFFSVWNRPDIDAFLSPEG